MPKRHPSYRAVQSPCNQQCMVQSTSICATLLNAIPDQGLRYKKKRRHFIVSRDVSSCLDEIYANSI